MSIAQLNVMSAPTIPMPVVPTISDANVDGLVDESLIPWRFGKGDFYRLGELGFFESDKVCLIGGEIFRMPPPSNIHSLGIDYLSDELRSIFGNEYWVRAQMGLDLSPDSVPIPDIAVVAGNRRSYHGQYQNPTTALLVVDVSLSTVAADRKWKASLYARAGIADYWILNIADRAIEVRRDPQPDPEQVFGFRYATLTIHKIGDFVSPHAMPDARIAVADVMPN